MSIFKSILDKMRETDLEEVARLAAAPVGSRNHELSKLPITMKEWPEDRPVMLPRLGDSQRTVVVIPYEYSPSSSNAQRRADGLKSLHDGSWYAIVIQSNDDRYPVGGHRIVVSTSELRRGRLIELGFDYDEVFGRP